MSVQTSGPRPPAACARRYRALWIGSCFLLGVWAGGFGCRAKAPVPASMPPTVVTVAHPAQQEVTEYLTATGRTEPFETVEVQARVQGFLESMHYRPRDRVEKDALLFVIDPRPYKARVDAAKAAVSAREADLKFARFDYGRIEKLAQQDAAAGVELVQSEAKRDAAEAALAEAKASLEAAELDLGFTRVTALIGGRASREEVGVGNLVTPNKLLATIVNDDLIYAYFDVSEQDVLRFTRTYPRVQRAPATRPQTAPEDSPPAFMGLMDEDGYPHAGWIDYADTQVDPGTGTLTLRAVFPNPDGFLIPGYFARIRAPLGPPRKALLVTERALGLDQGQRYVLVVNTANVVEYRAVRAGVLERGMRVIEEGIGAEDRVIVNGLQRVRPGVTVQPQGVDMITFAAASTRPAGSRPAGGQ